MSAYLVRPKRLFQQIKSEQKNQHPHVRMVLVPAEFKINCLQKQSQSMPKILGNIFSYNLNFKSAKKETKNKYNLRWGGIEQKNKKTRILPNKDCN